MSIHKSYDEVEEEVIKGGKGFASFRRLVGEMLAQRKYSFNVASSTIITAVTGALWPLTLGFAVNSVIAKNLSLLVFYAALFFLIFLIQFFSNRLRTISSTYLSQYEIKSLRDRAFGTLQSVPVSFYSKVKTGYLISRISNDGESISEFLTFQIPQVLSGITTVIISAGLMIYYSPKLALFSFLIIPFLIAFTFSIQPRVRKNYLRTRKTIAAITGNLAENINAIRAIKSFNVEKKVKDKFAILNSDNYRANMRASFISSLYGSIVRVIEAIGIAIVLIEGGIMTLSGAISVGIMVAFVVYVQEFFDPVVQLSQTYNSYQSAMVGLTRIYGIIDSERETTPEAGVDLTTLKDGITMKNVTFSYGEGKALDGVNLVVKQGEKVGIVGHTGAGKTTISNLMLKFYHPVEGEILVDGRNLENVSTKAYRELIAPVLQDPFMFRGTVLENVLFSKPDAKREYVEECIRKFGLYPIFSKMPEGIDTEIGEMGRNLSEGQRQAISILRAFVREPEVLILDEPTSQIDPESEKVIIEALGNFLKDKTLILITHRFSMIRLVDRVTVLDHGKVVQEGEVKELISSENGPFAKLYRTQGNTSLS